jgi:hypothetical protein
MLVTTKTNQTLPWLGFTLAAFMLFGFQATAQKASPPKTTEGKIGNATVKIAYSSPAVKGREIWGSLVPYGKVWRTGADNATTIEIDQDLTIEGKKLPKGKYALFTIPQQDKWVIIFNKEASQWGAYNYKENEDALRVEVTPMAADMMESFNISIDEKGKQLLIHWEKVKVPVKLS